MADRDAASRDDDAGAATSGPSPRVSVVLPTYERGEVVGEAVESVLSQTYADLELLVIDDGSTDGTSAVIEGFDDDRVRYHHRETRRGVSAARNAGIAAARGEIVAFVDSDDRWRAEKLQRQIARLDRGPPARGLVLTGITKPEGEPRTREGASGEIHEAVRRMNVPTYTSTLLVRAEALDRCGGFDERLDCFRRDPLERLHAERDVTSPRHQPRTYHLRPRHPSPSVRFDITTSGGWVGECLVVTSPTESRGGGSQLPGSPFEDLRVGYRTVPGTWLNTASCRWPFVAAKSPVLSGPSVSSTTRPPATSTRSTPAAQSHRR